MLFDHNSKLLSINTIAASLLTPHVAEQVNCIFSYLKVIFFSSYEISYLE